MAEPAMIHTRPTEAAPVPRRSRPALYADYLADQPIPAPRPRYGRWIVRQLMRLAFIAAVIAPLCVLLWSRR